MIFSTDKIIKGDALHIAIDREKGDGGLSISMSGAPLEVVVSLADAIATRIEHCPRYMKEPLWDSCCALVEEKLDLKAKVPYSTYDIDASGDESSYFVHIDKNSGEKKTSVVMKGAVDDLVSSLADALGEAMQSVNKAEREDVAFKLFKHVTRRMNEVDAK